MRFIKSIYKILFPANIDNLFSEECKENLALGVAARFTRGNINIQNKRATTARMFSEELRQTEKRVILNYKSCR